MTDTIAAWLRGRIETGQLTIASPVLDIARTCYTAKDRPVALDRMVLDAHAYLLEYQHPAPGADLAT
ncbi:MAG TPA: hypothetical protein VGL06_21070 [Pseudonocardiaceae bacterium]|jgi:DNA-binding GntR family transcriptional regulator